MDSLAKSSSAFRKSEWATAPVETNSCSFESNNDRSSETPYPFSLIRTQFQAANGDSEFLCAGMRVLPPCSLLLRFVLGDAGENDRFTVWELGYQG